VIDNSVSHPGADCCRDEGKLMSAEPTDTNDLHLPSLSIKGFRGIDELEIPRLGRVTLFTGKNAVGKTTLLDAVRVYAARGSYSVLTSILNAREELTDGIDGDGDKFSMPDWEALFHDRRISSDSSIVIGPLNTAQRLTIEVARISEKEIEQWIKFSPEFVLEENGARVLRVTMHDKTRSIPLFVSDARSASLLRYRLRADDEDFPDDILCESSGPSLMDNIDLARFWDNVALTDGESQALGALRLVFGDTVQGAAMVAHGRRTRHERHAIVRIKKHARPVPLKSLGDGVSRMFGVPLALANSRDVILLINETENGIIHPLRRDFWTTVLRTAHENNVQGLATTHGWDCVVGFAQAAAEMDDVDGALVRVHRKNGRVQAVEYSEDELVVAARQGIEVR